MRIELSHEPSAEDAATVLEALTAFNAAEVGPANRQPLGVFIRAEDGAPPVGGLTGYTAWGWLFTGNLWIGEALRGKGYAARILGLAETEAVRRGCHSAWIDTFNPVAKSAYEAAGYVVFGSLPHFVGDRTRFFLQKTLREVT